MNKRRKKISVVICVWLALSMMMLSLPACSQSGDSDATLTASPQTPAAAITPEPFYTAPPFTRLYSLKGSAQTSNPEQTVRIEFVCFLLTEWVAVKGGKALTNIQVIKEVFLEFANSYTGQKQSFLLAGGREARHGKEISFTFNGNDALTIRKIGVPEFSFDGVINITSPIAGVPAGSYEWSAHNYVPGPTPSPLGIYPTGTPEVPHPVIPESTNKAINPWR